MEGNGRKRVLSHLRLSPRGVVAASEWGWSGMLRLGMPWWAAPTRTRLWEVQLWLDGQKLIRVPRNNLVLKCNKKLWGRRTR